MTESEENDIQRLIRLKRYEQPPEGFVDDFMIRFHHRQRAEILNQSSFGLFWDRVSAFMTGRMTPASGLAYAVTAVVVVGGAVVLLPHGGSTVTVAEAAKPAPAVAKVDNSFVASPELGFAPEDHQLSLPSSQLAQLMSQHFGGGYADERRQIQQGLQGFQGFQAVNQGGIDPVYRADGIRTLPVLTVPEPLSQPRGDSTTNVFKRNE
jgi:hypothetical protein